MIGFHKSDGGIVMETIKERAEEFAQNFEIILKDVDCGGCGSCEKCKDYRRFVDIVTEQKIIDIEKTCKWLEQELQKIAVDEVKENFLENNFNIILKSQVPDWLINFRKAMEESE